MKVEGVGHYLRAVNDGARTVICASMTYRIKAKVWNEGGWAEYSFVFL